ncbi:hypothetical protein EJ02DRAFT_219495 [Clathrospora elynae]|uniref:Uncharacterized protein n=1 Tax=Clathrospora elynae TaxID=706981 RepID=A0A6A5SL26_9PLEO|nr:hypothetical protein EJ02DRAFT_219495 [Clathrospora elynae]
MTSLIMTNDCHSPQVRADGAPAPNTDGCNGPAPDEQYPDAVHAPPSPLHQTPQSTAFTPNLFFSSYYGQISVFRPSDIVNPHNCDNITIDSMIYEEFLAKLSQQLGISLHEKDIFADIFGDRDVSLPLIKIPNGERWRGALRIFHTEGATTCYFHIFDARDRGAGRKGRRGCWGWFGRVVLWVMLAILVLWLEPALYAALKRVVAVQHMT